jgi:hypothetical protein
VKTLIHLVVDRSGSMGGKERDVVGGINAFIAQQKLVPGEAILSMCRFDYEYEMFRPPTPLELVSPLAPEEYQPRGGTALRDAIGRSLAELDEAWSKHWPDRAICVICTDGEENSSREFTHDAIKAAITSREASGKWTFIFLGAGVNAFAQGASFGIHSANTAGYQAQSGIGTQNAYATASAAVGMMRATGATVATNLGGVLDEAGRNAGDWRNGEQKPIESPPPLKPPTLSTEWKPPTGQ